MYGRLCRRKPTRKANGQQHSVHAPVHSNSKTSKIIDLVNEIYDICNNTAF